jgi:hypothetical protein
LGGRYYSLLLFRSTPVLILPSSCPFPERKRIGRRDEEERNGRKRRWRGEEEDRKRREEDGKRRVKNRPGEKVHKHRKHQEKSNKTWKT